VDTDLQLFFIIAMELSDSRRQHPFSKKPTESYHAAAKHLKITSGIPFNPTFRRKLSLFSTVQHHAQDKVQHFTLNL